MNRIKLIGLNVNLNNHVVKTWLVLGLWLASLGMAASPVQAADNKQDLTEITDSVKQFLVRESSGLPGKIIVEVGHLDPRLHLEPCSTLEPFMPKGGHLWGKTTVGVRCIAPQQWIVYVSSNVKVWGTYYISAKRIAQGQTIGEADISAIEGDLTIMSSGIVTESDQAINHTSTMTISAGIPLRQDSLRLQQVILQGQTIRLVSNGSGFKVTSDGQALNNASEGQLVKVKTNSGQVLSGTAKFGGIVEVVN